MKFLHISDLHYSPATDGRTSRELREQLPAYLMKNRIQAEELLITGDYRHAVLQKDDPPDQVVSDVVEYILQISGALGIEDPKAHIHLIPGNHDRSRDKDSKRVKKIRKNYSSKEGAFSPDDLAYLKGQFGFFDLVCQKLYGDDSFWKTFPLHACRRAGNAVLLCMNTAVMHNGNQDRGRLLIGNNDLDRLLNRIHKTAPECPIVVLAHHPPDYFEEEEKKAVEDIFRKYPIQLYLCGDAHKVWWRQVNGYLEITMGCIKDGDDIQAAFLWGDTEEASYTAYHWAEAWEPYSKFNDTLHLFLIASGAALRLSDSLIDAEQRRIENEVLLPWMKHSVSLRAVFPRLFIKPKLNSVKLRGTLTYRDLDAYRDQNIAVIGDAGAGKTTLLRYRFLYENSSHDLLYLNASSLRNDLSRLNDYERAVRSILLGIQEPEKHYLVLLDGMDEAYVDDPAALAQLIRQISGKVSVWFGWRSEHYAQRETTEVSRLLTNVVSLPAWDWEQAEKYIRIYGEQTCQPQIAARFQELLDHGEDLECFTQSPFQLTLLVYLLENPAFLPKLQKYLASTDRAIFGLYEQFLECWLMKERERGTSRLPESAVVEELQEIANRLYYDNSYEISEAAYQDSAIAGLLTFTAQKHQRIATGFYHRSLCAFFCAKKISGAMQVGNAALVEALRIPLRNDVTDFVRSAVNIITVEELRQVQKNLNDTYSQVIFPRRRILDADARAWIRRSSEEQRFYLRNELVYLITRIPDPDHIAENLLRIAHEYETNPHMKLDVAYGAALAGVPEIALEYARSLIPGSESDITNRSWTVAYFGDVQDNPYHYRDTEKAPWDKSRQARLNRFRSGKPKPIRFRILDFPLMYCFYASRDWMDVNEADYEIIRQADVDCVEYTEEEKAFLREQKTKLLQEYRKHLDETS